MATTALLTCPKCHSSLLESPSGPSQPARCSGCGSWIEAVVFPAFYRAAPEAAVGENVLTEEEASCFVHPQKRATAPCDSCGRFICALCDIVIRDEHLCPECLEKGVRKKKLHNLENRRFLYDSLAMQLAVLPILMWPITIFTAPATLYVCVRYWKEPLGLLRRSRWRFVLAGAVALVQLSAWALLFTTLGSHFFEIGSD